MEENGEFTWSWFKENMLALMNQNEAKMPRTLAYLGEIDGIILELIKEPKSILKDPPQYQVAYFMCARALRLGTSGIYLALSGYPDCAMNIKRAIFEIGIKLEDMKSNPEEGALGFLLYMLEKDMQYLKHEMEVVEEPKEEAMEALTSNYKWDKEFSDGLETIAQKKGFDVKKAKNRYGKITMKELCEKLNLSEGYNTVFAFDSAYVHSRNFLDPSLYAVRDNYMAYELGPVERGSRNATHDILLTLMLTINSGCDLVGTESAKMRCNKMMRHWAENHDDVLNECERIWREDDTGKTAI